MNFFQQLDTSLSTFYHATDIPLTLLDESGRVVTTYGENFRYCQLFAQATGEHCPCAGKHLDSAQLAYRLGNDYIWTCPAGLFHFSVAITRSGSLLGSILGGPVLLDYPDADVVDEMLQQYKLPFSMKRQFYAALNDLPLVEPQKARHISKLLFCLVSGIFSAEAEFTSLQHEKSLQQSRIGEYIQIQEANRETDSSDRVYLQEQSLINYILLGNEEMAQEVLNQILGNMYCSSGNNLEIIRVQGIELFGVLTRALIRAGLPPQEAYGMTDVFQRQCLEAKNLEDLSYLLLATVKRMSSMMFYRLDERVSPAIRNSIQYINQHYYERLTLEQVAGVVSLSPTYLSGLFKAEMGQTFTEYIMNLRIERSQQLLRQTDLPLTEISQMTGFETQQYFNRVFKKRTGMSPLKYRNRSPDQYGTRE